MSPISLDSVTPAAPNLSKKSAASADRCVLRRSEVVVREHAEQPFGRHLEIVAEADGAEEIRRSHISSGSNKGESDESPS